MQHLVPAEVLAKIGDVMVSFSQIERALDLYITSLLRVPQRMGRCVTAGASFAQLRQMAIAIYIESFGEDTDFAELDDIAANGDALRSAMKPGDAK